MSSLHVSIATVFDQAQASVSNHRKNSVALYKLHVQSSKVKEKVKGRGRGGGDEDGEGDARSKLVGEKAFADVFMDMVSRVLVMKKGTVGAEKVVKFVSSYAKYLNDRVASDRERAKANGKTMGDDDDEDTLATRFVTRLVKWLLQGFLAKDKTIRYRCVHLVSEMITHLGEIDEDLYELLRASILDRINDKESLIRTHATIALSKLVGSEDPDEVQEGEMTILEILLHLMQYDPSPDVRRAALLNVPITPGSLDIILKRTRDTDTVIRKLIYSVVLKQKLKHPRMLTLDQREQVVKNGLGDREPGVRLAAGKMIGGWFDIMAADSGGQKRGKVKDEDDAGKTVKEEEVKVENDDRSLNSGGDWEGDDGGIMKALIQVLGLFDVVGPGEVIAVDAVLSIFVTRPELLSTFLFSETYWKHLTPESAVLARVFVEHSLSGNGAGATNENTSSNQPLAESYVHLEGAQFPVVTAFAFYIQQAYNDLLQALQEFEQAKMTKTAVDDEDSDEKEEELAKREVVLSELLRMAVKLDYGDEIGRRKVFSVVRDMLAHPELPPGLIEKCLDVMREITPSERDLIRIVVEIVVELRDKEDEYFSMNQPSLNLADTTATTFRREGSLQRTRDRKSMTHDEKVQADVTDMRCLLLCIGMLERVNGNFEDNSTLEGVLSDLIIPAVKRKELPMREKGLISLGLCCLIAKNMALNSFQLFINQVQNAPEHLQLQVLKVIFDLLIMYEHDFFGRSEEMAERIILFLLHTLENSESNTVKAGLCIGLSKLLLTGLVKDPRVLTSLLVNYVHPATADNQELRQCLSYFFPVFCYASPTNQSRMQAVFLPTLELIGKIHEGLDEDQKMISPYQLGLQMIDWTNPQKVASGSNRQDAFDAHADLTVDILASLYDSEKTEDEQKTLCQFLGQLQLSPGIDSSTLLKLEILLKHHEEQCPFNNVTLDKLFKKFQARFEKAYSEDLAKLNRLQLYNEQIQKLYEYIGVGVPEEFEAGEEPPRNARERNESQSEGEATPKLTRRSTAPSPAVKLITKGKGRVELEDKDEEDEDEEQVDASSEEGEGPPLTSDAEDEVRDSDEEVQQQRPSVATPRKRRGVKRVHTPGSAARVKKKNRTHKPAIAPMKHTLVPEDEEENDEAPEPDAESDDSRPASPTPVKKANKVKALPVQKKEKARTTTSRKGQSARTTKKEVKRAPASRIAKAPSPEPPDRDSDEVDELLLEASDEDE
ncbi:hypothetical protein AX16_002527 [Volvariella volvacea WC 439]|nr:hypothetical protein AX16_002527 [Volvariella volvacea WC 439]